MVKVKNLTPTTVGATGGTDLGIPFVMPSGDVWFIGGDTWDGDQPQIGGINWRSPMILKSLTRDMGLPIEFYNACRGGQQLWAYEHNNPVFSTVLPCDAVVINGRIYLWVMVTAGLGNEKWCEIWYSDDNGENWNNGTNSDTTWSTSAFGGKRVMMTWDRGRDGYVYAISTGGLARNKNALQWRVPEGDILDPTKWQGWCFLNGNWQWVTNPSDNQPTNILANGTSLGEIGLRWIQGHWVFSGFDAGAYNAFVRVGYGPISGVNWQAAPVTRPVKGAGFGGDIVPQLYGCYVHPDSRFTKADGTPGSFVMIVSTWNTATGNPYRFMQYRIPTPAPLGPIIKDPSPPDATEWDTVLAEFIGQA